MTDLIITWEVKVNTVNLFKPKFPVRERAGLTSRIHSNNLSPIL